MKQDRNTSNDHAVNDTTGKHNTHLHSSSFDCWFYSVYIIVQMLANTRMRFKFSRQLLLLSKATNGGHNVETNYCGFGFEARGRLFAIDSQQLLRSDTKQLS